MKKCKYFQQLLVEDFYNEINSQDKSKLDKHLETCEDCKSQLAQIQSTLNGMNQYNRSQPSEEFWDNYWINLESKLEQKPSWIDKLISRIQFKPSWIYGIATAGAFLIIGIFIGKSFFTPPQSDTFATTELSQKNIRTVANAEHYLQRSKVLLLGIVNMDVDPKSEYKPSISKQREISRELIQQTALLKDDLKETNQKILLELISELEVILLQIANLEKEYDHDAVEIIQKGLERKGMLIKINLGEILSTSHSENQTKNKKQI